MKHTEQIVKDLVYDNNKIIQCIHKFPHTYKTMLGDCCRDKTLQFILRRKINIMQKDGLIAKTIIPGTRLCEVMFYNPLKNNYHIIIEDDRIKIKVYCIFEHTKKGYYTRVKRYYELCDNEWIEKNEDREFFDGKCLKWV